MAIASSEPTKPSNRPIQLRSRRYKIIREIILVLLGLSACGATIFVGWVILMSYVLSGLNFNIPECNVSNPAGIEDVAHFKFPPSAKLLTAGCGGFQSLSASTSFEMKPSDLNVFLTTTNVKMPLSSSSNPSKLYCQCNKNGEIYKFLYGEYNKSGWYEEVFIDTHDKNLYTVYFTAFGD